MLSYVFPAIVTLITGIFAVFAVSHVCNKYQFSSILSFRPQIMCMFVFEFQKNDCCAIASILLTVILVFVCGGILLILYVIRIELPFLIPLIAGTLIHMIFTFVLLSFRTNDLKSQSIV